MLYINFGSNVFSQNGEDGITRHLLSLIEKEQPLDGWACEFGAWDGKYLSNTFDLVKNSNYNAVYIEGDAEKYKDLLKTCTEYPNIIPINAMVLPETFDKLLQGTKIPKHFDLLSIDIDSFDYEVWEALERYRPKIVIIEINSSFAPGIQRRHDPNSSIVGTSFTTMLELGRKKQYTFICHTGNMYFVANEYANLFEIPNPPECAFVINWLD